MTEIARFTINPSPAELIDLRRRARQQLRATALAARVQDDVVLVLSELTTNAIEAARPGSPVTIEVTCDPTSVTVAVENFGPPFLLPSQPSLPRADDLRGRGLAIATALATSLHTEHQEGRTRVVASCPAPGAANGRGELQLEQGEMS